MIYAQLSITNSRLLIHQLKHQLTLIEHFNITKLQVFNIKQREREI